MNDTITGGRPSSPLSPQEQSDERARRVSTLERATPAIEDMVERLGLIERAVGACLPEFIKDEALGDVVDMVSLLAKTAEKLEKAYDAIKARINYAKEVSVPARFDADKVKTFNTDKFRVTRTSRVFASIIGGENGETKEQAFEWLRENGYDSLIKETVNSSSLSATAKEVMENGMELPDDLFNTTTKDGVSITALKPKRG